MPVSVLSVYACVCVCMCVCVYVHIREGACWYMDARTYLRFPQHQQRTVAPGLNDLEFQFL